MWTNYIQTQIYKWNFLFQIYQLSNNGSPYWHDIPLFIESSNIKEPKGYTEANEKDNQVQKTKRCKPIRSTIFVETILNRNNVIRDMLINIWIFIEFSICSIGQIHNIYIIVYIVYYY